MNFNTYNSRTHNVPTIDYNPELVKTVPNINLGNEIMEGNDPNSLNDFISSNKSNS